MYTDIRNNCGVLGQELRGILSRNVQAKMAERKWEQPDIAKAAQVGQATISRILNCGGAATLDTIAALAGAFDCQPWELLVDGDAAREAAWKKILGKP